MRQPELNGVVTMEVMTSRPSFCPGEAIQGSLNVIPFVAVRIACISMELVCECHLEICGGRATSTHYYYFPYSKELFHTLPVTVLDAQATGGIVISAPTYMPFAIPLPVADLPSSLRSFPGKQHPFGVTYYLKINAIDPMGQLLNTTRCDVKVFSVSSFVGPEKPMLMFQNHEYNMFCCFPKSGFVVYCTTDKTVYCPGDQIKLSYWIETEKPETLPWFRSVSVSMELSASSYAPPGVMLLERHKWFGGGAGGAPTTNTFNHELFRQDLKRPSGSVYSTSLTLPSDCGPDSAASTVTGSCTLTWNYTVTLRLRFVNILRSNVNVVLPICINGKNSEQLTLMKAQTLRFSSLPDGALEAQKLYAMSANNLGPV